MYMRKTFRIEAIMKKIRILLLVIVSIVAILPQAYSATLYPENIDDMRAMVESASDGDVVDLVKLYSKDGYKNYTPENAKVINVNNNIKITSSDPINKDLAEPVGDFRESKTDFSKSRGVAISNVSFNVASGKTLTIEGFPHFRGGSDAPVIQGNGNLVINNRVSIEAKNGNAAISLPNGEVRINNVMSYSGEENTGKYYDTPYGQRLQFKVSQNYKSCIRGGNSTTGNGGEAVLARSVIINQSDLEFSQSGYYIGRGLFIRGGNSATENGLGGIAISAENVKVDLSAERNDNGSYPVIVGGSGGYPAPAIKGKNIDILCANNNKIYGGTGVNINLGESLKIPEEYYCGAIDIQDGGKLDYGSKPIAQNQTSSINAITGFDSKGVDGGSDEDIVEYFREKRWTNFYGPTILARGNANVNIHRGRILGIGSNYFMPQSAADKDLLEKLPISPIIEMGTGLLNIGMPSQIDEISISGPMHRCNTFEAAVLSKGDVNMYGKNSSIEHTVFVGISNNKGYSENKIAPKVGGAGIKTPGEVLIDGAHVSGSYVGNIQSDGGARKNEYRFGSGITDAKKVTIRNGAVVEGAGFINYNKYEKVYMYSEPNTSTGYGLENVGEVNIINSRVHGGDMLTYPEECGGAYCSGKGAAAAAISGATKVNVEGDSIIMGGSSVNTYRSKLVFSGHLQAGNGIEKIRDSIFIKGDVKIYGGGSATKAGNGIADSKNVYLQGEDGNTPTVFGGGCRNTTDTKTERAGSGIYNIENAVITAGNIQSGNMLNEVYLPELKTMMHPRTVISGFVGASPDEPAIFATGKVIIDGDENYTPNVMSYYNEVSRIERKPICSVKLSESGSLYVGKANVFSGGNNRYRSSNVLVEGGKYHVDVLKENNINSYLPDSDTIRYNSKNSVALYRILCKDEDGTYKDANNLTNSSAYDDCFKNDKGINLYKENVALSTEINKKALLRKLDSQGMNHTEINMSGKIKFMANDNIILDESQANIDSDNIKYPQTGDNIDVWIMILILSMITMVSLKKRFS